MMLWGKYDGTYKSLIFNLDCTSSTLSNFLIMSFWSITGSQFKVFKTMRTAAMVNTRYKKPYALARTVITSRSYNKVINARDDEKNSNKKEPPAAGILPRILHKPGNPAVELHIVAVLLQGHRREQRFLLLGIWLRSFADCKKLLKCLCQCLRTVR